MALRETTEFDTGGRPIVDQVGTEDVTKDRARILEALEKAREFSVNNNIDGIRDTLGLEITATDEASVPAAMFDPQIAIALNRLLNAMNEAAKRMPNDGGASLSNRIDRGTIEREIERIRSILGHVRTRLDQLSQGAAISA